MSSKTQPEANLPDPSEEGGPNENRRDFLYLTTGAVGVVGAACATWPFINSMNPAADTLALSTVDVELSAIKEGQAVTVMWQGKPVFIRHRTKQEIEEVRKVTLTKLVDPQPDEERFKEKPQWLVVVGVCTHLGCVPTGQKPTDAKGEFGGWLCPCHGSHYDSSGRVRKGPAPRNLEVPPYSFISDTTLRLG